MTDIDPQEETAGREREGENMGEGENSKRRPRHRPQRDSRVRLRTDAEGRKRANTKRGGGGRGKRGRREVAGRTINGRVKQSETYRAQRAIRPRAEEQGCAAFSALGFHLRQCGLSQP